MMGSFTTLGYWEGLVYLLFGVFIGLVYLLFEVFIGSNNFQEPTLKESETDPSMKKDNEIKRLSEASYEKISLPFPMSDNDYDDIDKTPSTAVLDDDNSEVIIGVSPSTSKPDADDNLDEHFWMNPSFLEGINDGCLNAEKSVELGYLCEFLFIYPCL
ncbi:uncharacterized protein LOC124438461 isoform X2 [Xenia sp. Carnegie-2017]|uniref:uncharacterized protein LOC124438461 isoform X2 n=1 Tax=Xenia sp. Carnegie-2017 TaxID=2897299 RepID=UPI001F044661|nr:uncharacterized protein LOC124438461 isoform X2 [Xenia sp. Carnegie-2017]